MTIESIPVGVMQTPVTPFTESGEVDYATLEKCVEFHTVTDRNVAIVALYNKSEPISLTLEERKQIVATTMDVVGTRLPVIVHVGHSSTDVAIELALHAQEHGATGVVCINPYYWPSSEEAVLAHFSALISRLDIAVMVYNTPHVEAAPLSPDMLLRLVEQHENLVGMKDASFTMDYFAEACRVTQAARPGFRVMAGQEQLLGSVVVGGTGSFSACGAIAPTMVYDLWDAITEERWDEARKLQNDISYLIFHFKDYYPSSLKVAMELMGRPVGPCRLPLPTADEDARARIAGVLKELNILETEPHGW